MQLTIQYFSLVTKFGGMKKILIPCIFLFIPFIVSGEEGNGSSSSPFWGTITSARRWAPGDPNYGSTVYVGTPSNPDLTIGAGGSLIIDPGITVIFTQLTSDLIITGSGNLISDGTAADSVVFTKASGKDYWGHITFETPDSETPITGTGSFAYCRIEYGKTLGIFPKPSSAGGAIQVNASGVTINNCTFKNNYARFGGAVTVNANQNTVIRNCLFKSNDAIECAGALLLHLNSSAVVENCIFEDNYCAGSTESYYGGGAIWSRQNTSKIVNCTFVNNNSPRAGDAFYTFSSPNTRIINSIFWGSDDQIGRYGTGAAYVNCAIQFSLPSIATNSFILSSDNSASNGPNFSSTNGFGWSLKVISPCRDAGANSYTGITIPSADYEGNPTINNKDIGAYEVLYNGWKTNAATTDWGTPGNWGLGVVPGPSTDILIPTGAARYPIGTSHTIGAGFGMVLDPGAQLTMPALTNNGDLKLRSDATNMSSLITDSPNVPAILELYLSGGGSQGSYKWHYISVPTTTDIPVGIFTTGITYDLASYNEPRVSSEVSQGWIGFDGWVYSTVETDYDYDYDFTYLELGRGYEYLDNNNNTFTFSGTLNSADVSPVATFKSGGIPAVNGFNLLGNPFPSGLDWDYIITHDYPENTSKSLFFTRNNVWCTYINGVGVPSDINGLIPPMQGFMVKTYGENHAIPLVAAARTHSMHMRYKGVSIIPLVRLSLSDDISSDETVVRFDPDAKSGFDYDFDAVKVSISPSNLLIYSSLSGTNYTINGQPFPETFLEIPITVNLLSSGNHSITASQLQGLDNYNVQLTDNSTGFSADLKANPVLNFTAASGSITDRFTLKVGGSITGTENPVLAKGLFNIYTGFDQIYIQTLNGGWEGKSGSVKILDLSGKTINQIHNITFSRNSVIEIPAEYGKGLFFVEIRSGIKRFVGKVLIK